MAKRETFSHKDCKHESTPKARAQCRKERAEAAAKSQSAPKPAAKKAPTKKQAASAD